MNHLKTGTAYRALRNRCNDYLSCGFATAIDEKEKCGEADEEQRAAEHPDFVRCDRCDLRCWEKRQRDAKNRRDQTTDTGKEQRCLAVAAANEIIGGGKFQQSSKHVNKWDELEHHSQ